MINPIFINRLIRKKMLNINRKVTKLLYFEKIYKKLLFVKNNYFTYKTSHVQQIIIVKDIKIFKNKKIDI